MCGYPCSSLISDCVRLRTFVWICRGFNVGAGWRAIAIDIYTTRYDVAACQPMPISQTPPAPNVGAGLPAIALGINTTLQAVAANANHDAKRAALDLDLLLILSAPLNHAGGLRAHRAWARCRVVEQENPKWLLPQEWICTRYNCAGCQAAFASKPAPTVGLRGVR